MGFRQKVAVTLPFLTATFVILALFAFAIADENWRIFAGEAVWLAFLWGVAWLLGWMPTDD